MSNDQRNPRCGETCCDWYWVFPERCLNCKLGLIHQGYGELRINPDGTQGPGRNLSWKCDSCDRPLLGQSYISTCPSGFTTEDVARDRAYRARL